MKKTQALEFGQRGGRVVGLIVARGGSQIGNGEGRFLAMRQFTS